VESLQVLSLLDLLVQKYKYWRRYSVYWFYKYKSTDTDAVESLENFETVKLFAAEAHELDEYSALIKEWQVLLYQ
jgi:ABC-type transport system involved in Fe-S cluster assembly fused permease/ATPase subunit